MTAFPAHERGAALLTVLLLVAVMTVVAATVLERLTLATRRAASGAAMDQARLNQLAVEQLALRRLGQMLSAKAPVADWIDRPLTLSLPQGEAEFRFSDGGNCFNLNSLASDDGDQRDRARTQFAALIQLNGVTASAAGRIVAQAADWVDGDQLITPGGGEDHAYGDGARTPDGPMADPSELLALPAMTSANWRLMAPWLCALPHRDASTFNINTLRPGQALLLGLMTPGLPLERARTLLAARPSGGFASTNLFATELSANATPLAPSLLRQLSLTSRWFRLHSVVHLGGIDLAMDSLVDVADGDPRIVQRRRETM